MDLIEQRAVSLNEIEVVVLDEADQMLDIGFMPAIKRILAMTPAKRQTLLFSATMPKEIRQLSDRHLTDPIEISVIPAKKTADRVEHSVMHMQPGAKMGALASLIRDRKGERVIVFTRTKRGADKAAKRLEADGINSAAIHGNKSQGQRERALAGFRAGTVPVLIATDIAARGIDVPGVSLVVNYELPNVPEVYVHRIGRTARAGAEGTAVTFCAPDERSLLRDIEKMLKVAIPVENAPEGTYVDALADPDGDFAPLNRTQRPRQGAKPQGQGRSGKPANLGWPGPQARRQRPGPQARLRPRLTAGLPPTGISLPPIPTAMANSPQPQSRAAVAAAMANARRAQGRAAPRPLRAAEPARLIAVRQPRPSTCASGACVCRSRRSAVRGFALNLPLRSAIVSRAGSYYLRGTGITRRLADERRRRQDNRTATGQGGGSQPFQVALDLHLWRHHPGTGAQGLRPARSAWRPPATMISAFSSIRRAACRIGRFDP
jgi:ATP-dependent RNA helicase RhlE